MGRSGAAAAYDPLQHEVVVFGGRTATGILGDTWSWDGMHWTNRTPPISIVGRNNPNSRYGGSLAFDNAVHGLVLFSGHGAAGLLNGTWLYQNHTWIPWTVSGPAPSVRADVAFVGDGATPTAILFGGRGASYDLNDTWRFDAAGWTNITAISGAAPPPRHGASASYDPGLAATVVFGGSSSSTLLNDTWVFSNGSWSRLSGGAAPSPRSYASMAFDPLDGGLLLMAGQTNAVVRLADLWALNGSNWTPVPASGGPSGRAAASLDYLPSTMSGHGETLLFGGAPNALATVPETWLYGSHIPLSSTAPNASVGQVDPGGSVTFVTFPFGGGGTWYRFSWAGLPNGCSSVNLSILTCTVANSPGSLSVSVTVTDPTGVSSTSPPTTIKIDPPPHITAFLIPGSPFRLGQNVTFLVNATGGTGALSYSFTGLPPGCQSANLTSITCTPRSAGSFIVRALVRDGFGANDSANNSLVVKAPVSVATTPWLLYAGVGMVAIAVLGLAVLAVVSRQRAPRGVSPASADPGSRGPSPPSEPSPPKAG